MDAFPKTTTSDALVIFPHGRLIGAAASELREQLRDEVSRGTTRLVVDMSGVDVIDSVGLSPLISRLKTLLTLTNLHLVLEARVETSHTDSETP